MRSEKSGISQNTRLTITEGEHKSDGVHRCVLAADSLLFFLVAQARKLSLSASLERAEEPLRRHARVSNGDAAIEVLRLSTVFWVDRLVLVALGRSSWWKSCPCDRHRRGTLCYGMYPWARLLPRSPPVEVHDLSCHLGSSIVPKSDGLPRGCWPSENMPCKLDKK